MDCKLHSGRPAGNTCCICGEWLCDECAIELNGRIFCKSCVSKRMDTAAPSAEESRTYETPHPSVKEPKRTKRPISSFFLFVCATIPGCGQMYLGLLKRGMLFMVAFYSMIYLTAQFDGVLGVFIPIFWFVSFFDAFNQKNKIVSGETVKDDIDDLKSFAIEHRTIIIGLVVIFIALEFISSLKYFSKYILMHGFPWMGSGMLSEGFSRILVAGFVLVIVLLISRKSKSSGKEKNNQNNDTE